MKKLLLLPAMLLTGAAHAQTNALKVDIFQPVINTLAVSFEHKLSETSSFQIGLSGTFSYSEDGDSFTNESGRKTSGFAITPEYRLYLSEKHPAPEGFYVAPFVRYQYLSQTGFADGYYSGGGAPSGQPYEASLNAFGLGVTVGRHWIFKQRFSLDIFAGPAYTVTSISSDNAAIDKDYFVSYFEGTNYDFRGGVTFGLAF
ncbi:DUF3575 domain-containing protein [uncultured Hymenobacter sp.]|uniref:DUF3575 domain-containing protein n=1 Tax=uncultured Hymenobacter sp. TaxID=170016 RepID=UPI0035CA0BA6